MTGRHRATPVPEITAGEPEFGNWCPVCLEDWRVRLPLLADGRPAGGIEFCPGCGTGHDKPGVYLTPPGEVPLPERSSVRPGPVSRLRYRLGLRVGCAYGDCPWPGRQKLAVSMPGDEGTWTYTFCRKRHRRKWAAENGILA